MKLFSLMSSLRKNIIFSEPLEVYFLPEGIIYAINDLNNLNIIDNCVYELLYYDAFSLKRIFLGFAKKGNLGNESISQEDFNNIIEKGMKEKMFKFPSGFFKPNMVKSSEKKCLKIQQKT